MTESTYADRWAALNRHSFSPSRPGGTVCTFQRVLFTNDAGQGVEVCGYPAGHPIHDVPPSGRSLALRRSLHLLRSNVELDVERGLTEPSSATDAIIENIVKTHGGDS